MSGMKKLSQTQGLNLECSVGASNKKNQPELLCSVCGTPLYIGNLPCFDEFSTVVATPFDIHETNDGHGGGANSEQKGESHPIILGIVNDGLDHVGADYRGLHGVLLYVSE